MVKGVSAWFAPAGSRADAVTSHSTHSQRQMEGRTLQSVELRGCGGAETPWEHQLERCAAQQDGDGDMLQGVLAADTTATASLHRSVHQNCSRIQKSAIAHTQSPHSFPLCGTAALKNKNEIKNTQKKGFSAELKIFWFNT